MKCAFCGKEIESKTGKKFCSIACSTHYNHVLIKNKSAERLEKLKEEYDLHPVFCKNCGKPLSYEQRKGKFCNHSCAASFVNPIRDRKKWTEEQKKRASELGMIKHGSVPVEAVCKYCGKLLGKTVSSKHKNKVCEECRPFIPSLKIFEKMGYKEGPLKERDRKAFQDLYKLYFEDKLGVISIAQKTEIRHISLLRFFKKHGIDRIRTVSEGLQAALLTGIRDLSKIVTPQFHSGYHISWEGLKFFYRSGYELEYAKYLDNLKIRYRYEDVSCRIKYFNTTKSTFRVAVPDFYLPDTNEIVEIKSSYTLKGKVQELKDKVKAYREQGFSFKLILDKKETDLFSLKEEDFK